MSKDKVAHFEIDASIVFQLGEDLITDVVQAMVELVKNSYDADADFAKVEVNTGATVQDAASFFPKATGYISIEDNGTGMDEEAIEKGWLTISKSPKRRMKADGKTTGRGRTPLGDKGLGRLGAQRLGYNVEIFTQPKGSLFLHHVGWSWRDFQNESTLSRVKLRWEILDATRKRGTKILISDIREPSRWQGDAYGTVATQLSQVISPYKKFQDFEVFAKIDGKEIELAEISQRVRNTAQVRYKIAFNEDTFKIDGKARLDLLRPKSKDDMAAFETLVLADEGARFFSFLERQKEAESIRLRRSTSSGWFVEFSSTRKFTDFDKLERPAFEKGLAATPVSPGPFMAEIDAFDLSPASASQSTFDTTSEYRQHIKTLSGVRIYRDGFGIRVDRDWLGLGKQWTTASSYYGLKPDNTLGYVALTALNNASLVETTDREGFKDTPAHRNFLKLFGWFVEFAHSCQEFLRRNWTTFKKENEKEVAGIESAASAEDVTELVATGIRRVASYRKPVQKLQSTLESVAAETERVLDGIEHSAGDAGLAQKCAKAKDGLMSKLEDTQEAVKQLANEIEGATKLLDLTKVLGGQIGSLREQLEMGVEAMSLGLTAEVLSHEIANIADQLTLRTADIGTYLKRNLISDSRIHGFIEYVATTTNGLRRQLSHLSPSLKYVRTRRHELSIRELCSELSEYHLERWKGVAIRIVVDEQRPMTVKIHRGKLIQVLDNLILNSDYWLREDIVAQRIESGTITLRIASPYLVISDNGQGIDETVEGSLFEPFVTRKKEGRGLGLYVVQQLLNAEGCTIRVRPRRNSFGRLYQFEINMAECLVEGDT